MTRVVRLVEAGDSVIVAEFERRIDPHINARAIALAEAVEAAALPGVRDVVPTYHTVAVHFDPLRTPFDRLTAVLEGAVAIDETSAGPSPAPIEVPVCYGGEYGPDLAEVAGHAGCTEDEVVRRHAGRDYRVYMLGFVPGFAFMASVDPVIAIPRRATPRLSVPSGSVGIANAQTGIYPCETPGGWRLVGRTPLRPFDLERARPFLFTPGDVVRFVPVSPDRFRAIEADERHRPAVS